MSDTNGTNGWTSTTVGQELQQQLNDKDIAQGIGHVLQRMNSIEKAVEKLTLLMQRGPGMVSMVTDMVDDGVRQAAHRGVEVEQHLKAGTQMLERLTHPQMVQKLNNLMDLADQMPGLVSMTVDMVDDGIKQAADRGVRLDDRLGAALDIAEKLTAPEMVEKLDNVLQLANQAPGLISMTVDMVDDSIKQAADRGVRLDERLGAALDIAEKLTAPEMVEKLDNLLQLANQAPGLISMTVDMVDDSIKQAADRGVRLDERLGAALNIAEKLTAPEMVEKLDNVLQLANQAPGLISMTVDMVDDGIKQAADRGVFLDERIQLGLEAAEKLTSPTMINQLNQLIELGQQAPGLTAMMVDMLDDEYKKAVASGIDFTILSEMAGTAGQALSNSRQIAPKKLGLWGLMRAMNDEDRQKAMGFLMEFLKQFGQKL